MGGVCGALVFRASGEGGGLFMHFEFMRESGNCNWELFGFLFLVSRFRKTWFWGYEISVG